MEQVTLVLINTFKTIKIWSISVKILRDLPTVWKFNCPM